MLPPGYCLLKQKDLDWAMIKYVGERNTVTAESGFKNNFRVSCNVVIKGIDLGARWP